MMPGRLVTGVAILAAVGVGGVAGAMVAVPSLSGAQTYPGANTVAAPATPADPANPAPPPMPPLGKHVDSPLLDAAAKALNLTTQQLLDKLSDGKTTIADVAKAQGVDVQTVIDAMTNADRDRISNIVNNPLPKFRSEPGGAANMRPRAGFGILGAGLDAVAKALGISPDELKSDFAKGQSIADIAKSKNLDLNKVIDAIVADASAKIDAAVKDGHLSADQAAKLKSTIKSAITAIVNNDFPKLPAFKGGGRFHMGGHGGFGGFGPGPAPGSSAPGSSSTTTPPTTTPPTTNPPTS